MDVLAAPATPERRQIHIFGGATAESTNDNPLSGQVAKRIGELTQVFMPQLDTRMHLTDAAGGELGIETDEDLYQAAHDVVANYPTKMVFWVPDSPSSQDIAPIFRQERVDGMAPRKDIFLIGMTATKGVAGAEQFDKGLNFVKGASANLDLAYDYGTHNGMVVAPEESRYEESTELDMVLRGLLEMSYLRSQLTFTRSTVVGGEPVDWNGSDVYPTLRQVVDFCIENGAYKPFMGVTAGHFACKVGDTEFLTSRRKTNFNNLDSTGLVRVITDGPDKVVAMGGKPSVGGQSQRIVFEQHPERDSIVHFHCPPKPGSKVPVVSQREYECGSHECGQNTSSGLIPLLDDSIEAVMLDNHGPNIVFHHEEDPAKIIEFIQDNFDLTKKTGGYTLPAAA